MVSARTVRRGRLLLKDYGLTPQKMLLNLKIYCLLLRRYNAVGTFPVPALVLERYSKILNGFRGQVEFAVHGYSHKDYSTLTYKECEREFAKGKQVFSKYGLSPSGFRAPYLKWSGSTLKAAASHYIYDSSQSILWDDRRLDKVSEWIESFYRPSDASTSPSLPTICKGSFRGFVLLPVSLPDDELLHDRLKLSRKAISEIWMNVLEKTYRRGEMFVLQLHPERIKKFGASLDALLKNAVSKNPKVWVASLKEIAEWWKERNEFSLTIEERNGEYPVKARVGNGAIILSQGLKSDSHAKKWFGNYLSIEKRNFNVTGGKFPGIGIHPGTEKALHEFLETEGYVVEESKRKERYALYFDSTYRFKKEEKLKLLDWIESQSSVPLLRIWRWPDEARSVLSVTGDIDAITLSDYARRLVE